METFELSIDDKMFSDGKFRVDGDELRTDAKIGASSTVMTEVPLMITCPASGRTLPPLKIIVSEVLLAKGEYSIYIRIMLKVVVFPAPLGPSKANTVSVETPMLRSSKTRLPLYDFEIFKTRRTSSEIATACAAAVTSSFEEVFPLEEVVFLKRREPESAQMRMAK